MGWGGVGHAGGCTLLPPAPPPPPGGLCGSSRTTAAEPGRTTCIGSPSSTPWRTSGRECLSLMEGAEVRGP